VTTRIQAHALMSNAQIALVDAGCFTEPAALSAFLEVGRHSGTACEAHSK